MLTIRLAVASALLALIATTAVALMPTQEDRKTACVSHVQASGVPGATPSAALEVCETDYIKRYSR